MKAELRSVRENNDEYVNYLVIIQDEKTLPYLHIPDSFPYRIMESVIDKINDACDKCSKSNGI